MRQPSLYINFMIRGVALVIVIPICVPLSNVPHSLRGIHIWSRRQLTLIRHYIIQNRLVAPDCTYLVAVLVLVPGKGNLHLITLLEYLHYVVQLSLLIFCRAKDGVEVCQNDGVFIAYSPFDFLRHIFP